MKTGKVYLSIAEAQSSCAKVRAKEQTMSLKR